MEKTIDYESIDDLIDSAEYNARMEQIQVALLNRNPEFVDEIYFFSQKFRKDLQQRKQDIYEDKWRPNWIK